MTELPMSLQLRAIAVAIGKLWIVLGKRVWGIFNFETYEWRCSRAPPEASIRYGAAATWLPPYMPFLPSFEVSSTELSQSNLKFRQRHLIYSTNMVSQYFWLLQQGRRPGDNIHTILLLGGYDHKGRPSNEIDQITILLPPSLAVVS